MRSTEAQSDLEACAVGFIWGSYQSYFEKFFLLVESTWFLSSFLGFNPRKKAVFSFFILADYQLCPST